MERRIAITRKPARSLSDCEITHIERRPIDYEKALEQHDAYETSLKNLGCEVLSLPVREDFPDSCFVEDAAVVFEEFAVLMRPAAESRRREVEFIEPVLKELMPIKNLPLGGTIDGGDVLKIGRTVFVGLSTRSNRIGAESLEKVLGPCGYLVKRVEVKGSLHLKTAVTYLGKGTVLINPKWVDVSEFSSYRQVFVDEEEPFGANTTKVRDTLICSRNAPRTNERLEQEGFRCESVDISEFEKAEAGVSCLSFFLEHNYRQ